jgi:hypothetical protein
MTDYRTHTGAGTVGTANITNDDKFLLELPAKCDDEKFKYGKIKDKRSF